MSKLSITWKKSTIGYGQDQRRTIRSLGLRRLHQTVTHRDTPVIRGMLRVVRHLVEVKEVPEERPPVVRPAKTGRTQERKEPKETGGEEGHAAT